MRKLSELGSPIDIEKLGRGILGRSRVEVYPALLCMPSKGNDIYRPAMEPGMYRSAKSMEQDLEREQAKARAWVEVWAVEQAWVVGQVWTAEQADK